MTDNTQDRIRIAEAVGASITEHQGKTMMCWPDKRFVGGYTEWDEWNPFTSADDDYAVLCFARDGENSAEQYLKFRKAYEFDYVDGIARWYLHETGDYARAYLRMLNETR